MFFFLIISELTIFYMFIHFLSFVNSAHVFCPIYLPESRFKKRFLITRRHSIVVRASKAFETREMGSNSSAAITSCRTIGHLFFFFFNSLDLVSSSLTMKRIVPTINLL